MRTYYAVEVFGTTFVSFDNIEEAMKEFDTTSKHLLKGFTAAFATCDIANSEEDNNFTACVEVLTANNSYDTKDLASIALVGETLTADDIDVLFRDLGYNSFDYNGNIDTYLLASTLFDNGMNHADFSYQFCIEHELAPSQAEEIIKMINNFAKLNETKLKSSADEMIVKFPNICNDTVIADDVKEMFGENSDISVKQCVFVADYINKK